MAGKTEQKVWLFLWDEKMQQSSLVMPVKQI